MVAVVRERRRQRRVGVIESGRGVVRGARAVDGHGEACGRARASEGAATNLRARHGARRRCVRRERGRHARRTRGVLEDCSRGLRLPRRRGARRGALARASLDSAHIPAHHRPLLANAVRELDRAEACAEANTAFTRAAIDNFVHNPYAPEHLRVPKEEVERWAREAETFRAAKDDVDKVRYVLKNAYRDWSSDGAVERDAVYGLIFDALRAKFNVNVDVGSPDGEAPRVLAPGCGLGRLVFELARQGYDVQGNEFSYFMLFFSSFMLNATRDVGEFGIHPFMHSRSNHRRMEDAWRETRVPDVVPGDVTFPPGASMSMSAGDFTAVYGTTAERGQWDAVVTAYFIDTAHNVCEYLECVANCLRTGGVWVNFGPLLYHWEEYHDEVSVELSLDDVIAAAESFGLRVEKCEFHDAMYTSDERSFHKTTYTCAFIVAVKE